MYKGNFASDMLFLVDLSPIMTFVSSNTEDSCLEPQNLVWDQWRKNIKQSDKVWPQKHGKNRENILMAS